MVGEASRANGAKGGRPRGSLRGTLPPEEYEARKKARKSLQELCQRREEEHVEVLEAIAENPEEPANARISPISLLFDRGRGKAVQPEQHSGSVVLVVTGVQRHIRHLSKVRWNTVWLRLRRDGLSERQMLRLSRLSS